MYRHGMIKYNNSRITASGITEVLAAQTGIVYALLSVVLLKTGNVNALLQSRAVDGNVRTLFSVPDLKDLVIASQFGIAQGRAGDSLVVNLDSAVAVTLSISYVEIQSARI
jgi:hypothetical protein